MTVLHFYGLSVLIAWIYVCLISYIIKHWNNLSLITNESPKQQETPVTIIIIARNEAQNIQACLESIINNSYPQRLVKIILVDDHSTDDTVKIASLFKEVMPLQLSDYLKEKNHNNFKKAGIAFALENSTTDFIITTDADCIVSPDWIDLHVSSYNLGNNFNAAAVKISPTENFLHAFEALDLIGMMGVTAAGIKSQKWHMANGANMSFRKSDFMKLNPYKNDAQASGDDIKLVQSIAKAGIPISFIKNPSALVETIGNPSFAEFVQQRIRWGTKNKNSVSFIYSLIILIPFLLSWFIIINSILIFTYGTLSVIVLLLLVFMKLGIDFFYLKSLSKHYDQNKLMRFFIPAALMHILYIALIGLVSIFIKRYKWKGRKII